MKYSLVFILGIIVTVTGFGQESKLAQQYFRDGEFEKAATLYAKLYDKNQRNDYYFDRYIESLISLEEYVDAEKAIKKQIKKKPKEVKLYVTYGNLYERQYKDEEAQKQYETAIKKMPDDRFAIIKLANAFITLTKFDLATRTYERGVKLLNDSEIFAYNLGDLYRRKAIIQK